MTEYDFDRMIDEYSMARGVISPLAWPRVSSVGDRITRFLISTPPILLFVKIFSYIVWSIR